MEFLTQSVSAAPREPFAVAVKKEVAERAMRALAGQVVGGRTVSAEPAKARGG